MSPHAHPADATTEILIVEDSPTQAARLRYLLEQSHYRVLVAGNGKQALAVLAGHKPTLVISDINMPEMDGYELCKSIKEDPSTSGIPVILLTTLNDADDVFKGLACGADNFITKPYSEDYLISSLDRIIAGRGLRKIKRERVEVEIIYAGKKCLIPADPQQVLTLLLSTYEAAAQRNVELARKQNDLRLLNERLEELVSERTANLIEEIEERKRVEEALKKSQALLNETGKTAKMGGWEFDVDTLQQVWTEEVYRIHEINDLSSRLTVSEGIQFYAPESRPVIKQVLQRAIEHGEPFDVELEFVTAQGRRRWVYVVGQAHQESGKTKKVLGTFQDITERKLAEQERGKLATELQQSQKMEAVGRLVGGVAHDFNNMLSVILGYTDIAMEQVKAEQPIHSHLEEVSKAAQRSADLTRQLLTFARKQVIAPKVLDLNKTVDGMLKMLQQLIGENVRIVWQPAADIWPVMLDPSQIDQILANLCINAKDSIADVGTITIETGNCTFSEEYCASHAGFVTGEYVRIVVGDTGCGMDEKNLSHIFEPFFTTKAVGKGTGLGLATVYGAVNQNSGFINVRSEPGQGTTFTIYLPRHKGAVSQMHKQAPAQPVARGHKTIMLVEDDPAILKLGALLLEQQGYSVLSASTPGEAIRLAREKSCAIHLLITDVVMPEMNGSDLTSNLRSLHPELTSMFMSGYTSDVIAHHGILDQGVNFIQKPFSKNDLIVKVQEALAGA